MSKLDSPHGSFTLERFPKSQDPSLRAWDAADEYLIEHTFAMDLNEQTHIWLINDQFGTLATCLNTFALTSFSDSWLTHHATRHNLSNNGLSADTCALNDTLSITHITEQPKLVVVKLPKSLAMLEDQLIRLIESLPAQTPVVFAGMVKHMSNNIWPLIEKYFGKTHTSLAKKKAKLIFATAPATVIQHATQYPSYYQVPEYSLNLANHAGVFSRDSLDIGTRFLLEHMTKIQLSNVEHIVDLACGNGIIGIQLAKQFPNAHVTFTDESFMAIASAKLNVTHHLTDVHQHRFCTNNGLDAVANSSQDLIVVNPPFHQQNTVSDHMAKEMLRHSKRCLKADGELWVIANRHLGYHASMKRLFGHCDLVSSNKKFVILRVQKSQQA